MTRMQDSIVSTKYGDLRFVGYDTRTVQALDTYFGALASDDVLPPEFTTVKHGRIPRMRRLGPAQVIVGVQSPSADGSFVTLPESRTWRGSITYTADGDSEVTNEALKAESWKPDDRVVVYGGIAQPHFGHFIVESLSRAWLASEYREKSLPVAVQSPGKGNTLPAFALTFYALLDLPTGTPELITQSTVFREVLVPAPSFIIRAYSSRKFRSVCVRVTENALAQHSASRSSQPLYLSRSKLDPIKARTLIGEVELERYLESQGFKVAHPQELSILEQIALINSHDVIVGSIGSAMHLLTFRLRPATVYYLSHGIPNSNFFLCDHLAGHRVTYVNACYRPTVAAKLPQRISLNSPWIIKQEQFVHFLRSENLISGNGLGPEENERAETLFVDILRKIVQEQLKQKKDGDLEDYAARTGLLGGTLHTP